MNGRDSALLEFKFGVSKKVVYVYSPYKDIDPMVVKKIDFVEKNLRGLQGVKSEYKAHLSFKFFMPDLEVYCLATTSKHMVCLVETVI